MNLDCLQYYLYENCLPWDEDTSSYAVYKRHMDCLKYLHKNGCPWYKDICKYAQNNDCS